MNDPKIEQSDERCFGRLQPLEKSIEISFHIKTSVLLRPEIYKASKPFWHSNRQSWTESVWQEW